ncbi:MAG TPA: SbmA/BacA-like family transporter [Candidatus Polarisedimenticolia bacterium]|nr:SbmA/BacA-like family transporter [Candidatus Polarisedimenticolia bacterium]
MTSERRVRITRTTSPRLGRAVKDFSSSEVGWHARGLLGLLVALLVVFNVLNVLNSYVGRDFMTAVANRDAAGVTWQAIVYLGVFAASALVGAFWSFSEQRLGLLWREWLTRQLLGAYLHRKAFYRLSAAGMLTNPDQRIAEDVKAFTAATLSFVVMLANATMTVVAFSGVLWSISRTLFAVALVYAACGSALTVLFGRPLIWLNYNQLDREADFRASLVHVQANAESIALLHREDRLGARLRRQLDGLAANMRRLIAVHRNLAFFTNGYNYLIQIIPALVVAPLFIRGEVEFGVITQSMMAFAVLLGALSLVVTQFQSISSFAAVIARLGSLADALEGVLTAGVAAIDVQEDESRLAYERLTLRSPGNDHVLVRDLSGSIPRGTRTLIVGPNDAAKAALIRATAGLWEHGSGRIVRPGLDAILFLPERPYPPPGTLRDALLPTGREGAIGAEQVVTVLRTLDLDDVLERMGGLSVQRDWDEALSLGEQQLLCIARVVLAAPHFVVLERPSAALGAPQVDRALRLLRERSITYITVGGGGDRADDYQFILELAGDGGWTWKALGVAVS